MNILNIIWFGYFLLFLLSIVYNTIEGPGVGEAKNRRELLILSAIWHAKLTKAKCTPTEIAKILTTQPLDIDSDGDDVLLQDLVQDEGMVKEVNVKDFEDEDDSSSNENIQAGKKEELGLKGTKCESGKSNNSKKPRKKK